MMNDKLKIKKENLSVLYDKIKASGKEVYAPQKTNNAGKNSNGIDFALLSDFSNFSDEYIRTVSSLKSVVFPKYENILKYCRSQEGMKVEDMDLSAFPDTVLFGVHPCDAASFSVLNSVFTWELNDKFVKDKLNKMTVIGLSCHKSDDYCFCTSVKLSPISDKGSDILLTKLDNGDYHADIITEKGKTIYNLSPELFEKADSENEVVTEVAVKFDSQKVTEKLQTSFENPIWFEQALRCISCGACAYVCPTCSCFDIQDLGGRNKGFRTRCWDSCGFSNFTAHASGHNPREEQSQRWRQRIMHKFSYQPDRLNTLGCVGCGRCSAACPVDMNIQEHVTAIDNNN